MKRLALKILILTLFLPLSFITGAEEVQQIRAGEWPSNFRAPSGERYGWYWDANTWVDIKVEDLGFNKRVGVRWTIDNWVTSQDSHAIYEHALEPGFEQWGVDITPALVMSNCYWCSPADRFFEYAIFYEDLHTGNVYWDNNNQNNYQLTLPGDR